MKITHTLFVTAFTLLVSGVAQAAAPVEGAYPGRADGSSGVTRAQVNADAARWNEAGMPGLIRGEYRPQFVPSYQKTMTSRAEVKADLDLWHRAGFSAAGRGEASPDLNGREYQARLDAYRKLMMSSAASHRAGTLAMSSTPVGSN